MQRGSASAIRNSTERGFFALLNHTRCWVPDGGLMPRFKEVHCGITGLTKYIGAKAKRDAQHSAKRIRHDANNGWTSEKVPSRKRL